jgi:hypothetical protein
MVKFCNMSLFGGRTARIRPVLKQSCGFRDTMARSERLSAWALSGRRHVASAFGWTPPDAPDWPATIATVIGMGAPILLGQMIHRPGIGLAAAVGGLWVGNAPASATLRDHYRALMELLAVAIAAAICSATIAGQWWSGLALIPIAGAAALIGGYSRPLAVATQRFIVFTAIGIGVASTTPHRAALAIIIVEGAVWTALVALAAGAIARAITKSSSAQEATESKATSAYLFRRWRSTLRGLAGWQYAIRLTACLIMAEIIAALWPDHHYSWIVVAVAILSQRAIERWPIKVTQRAIGVGIGVLLSELLFAQILPEWLAIICFVAIAGAMPWLRRRSYLLYSAAMTPLIMLVMSAGHPVTGDVLVDRLVATLVAAVLVLTAGWVIEPSLRPRPSPGNPRSG